MRSRSVRAPRLSTATILLLLGSLAACSSRDRGKPVESVVRWLADDVAATMGRTTATALVAGVTRAALLGVHTDAVMVPASNRMSIEPAGAGAVVSFPCPAELLGRPAVLYLGSPQALVSGVQDAGEVQRFECPGAPGTPARVRLQRRRPDPAHDIALVQGLERSRVETGSVTLPAGARLRVALGLYIFPGQGAAGPGRFHVIARDEQGRTANVLERRLDPASRPEDGAWVGMDLDLEPVRHALGPDVRFVFEAEAEDEGLMPTLPVWGDPVVVIPSAAPPRNVVLVSLDTLRPDRLGMYGARRQTSPTLDALAADATVFEDAIAPAPWTTPSHTSMMTGLHACVHGMVTKTIGKPFPPGLVPLAQRLREAGYRTAAFTEDGLVDAAAFSRGFGYYWENRGGDDRVRETVAHAVDWLRDEAAEPFFVFFHTYQTHEPYFSPPPFAGMFSTTDGSSAEVSGAPASMDLANLAKHDAAIRYTDSAIEPLLAAIRARPLGERTLLVVTSDHGEAFGEHGYTGHGWTQHEEVLRVPLLFWGRGLVAQGRRVPGLVGLIDLTPTILDLLGMPVPARITGTSLAAQVRAGGNPPPVAERVLFSENSRNDLDKNSPGDRYRLAARAPSWKAMWERDSLQLFDLVRDPGERAAVAIPGLAARAGALRTQFEQECERQKAELDAAGRAVKPPPVALPDPDAQRRLKALGYVE